MDIIITLPRNVSWDEYQKELDAVIHKSQMMSFKIPTFPKNAKVGDKCYICHKGFVVGYMLICGFSTKKFICTTTGKEFSGNFVERTGKFYKIDKKIPYKGFQGYRYYNPN